MSLKNILYYTFFSSFEKKNQIEKNEIWKEYREIKSELEGMKNMLDFEAKRFERLKQLMKGRVHTITTTKYDKHVYLRQEANERSFRCIIYDLDNTAIHEGWMLQLDVEERAEEFFIRDIQGGKSLGHGEIAMDLFFQHLEKRNIKRLSEGLDKAKRIWGKLSPVDKDRRDRQRSYYTKMGFDFDLKNMMVSKNL